MFALIAFALTACASEPASNSTSSAIDGAGIGAAVVARGGASAGTGASGGNTNNVSTGGRSGSAGAQAPANSANTGGRTASGASGNQGGAGATPSSAGASATGTAGNAASGATGGAPASGCGSGTKSPSPFGCKFAWGTNDSGGSLASLNGLAFVSKWVGYEVKADATLPGCDGCSWLAQQVASTTLVPVYYAYFVGYLGHANGFADGNQNPNGPNLTTDGAKLIRDHRSQLVGMYASYAKQSAAVWKDKPLVWLLEGDYVQYSGTSQKEPLSMTELAQFAADVTCAIKSNMPNAVVAINHSTWNSDQVTNDFWGSLKNVDYDLVWTTGVANNAGFLEAGTKSDSYNHATATYAYVHGLTARPLFVDTSFGLSAMADSWSGSDAATLNARIADGVIAANVTDAPQSYVAKVTALGSMLQTTCKP